MEQTLERLLVRMIASQETEGALHAKIQANQHKIHANLD
jgi:hypothetical protein